MTYYLHNFAHEKLDRYANHIKTMNLIFNNNIIVIFLMNLNDHSFKYVIIFYLI